LVFVASLLSTQHQGERAKTGWLGMPLEGASDCCFNATSAIFQLYHGENKLIFNEMMMMSTLY
jgi:hypothetical protein